MNNIYIESIKKGLAAANVGHNTTFAALADHLMDLHMTLIAGLCEVSDVDLSIFNEKGESLFGHYLELISNPEIEAQHFTKTMANVAMWFCAAYTRLKPEEQQAILNEFTRMAVEPDFFERYFRGGKSEPIGCDIYETYGTCDFFHCDRDDCPFNQGES